MLSISSATSGSLDSSGRLTVISCWLDDFVELETLSKEDIEGTYDETTKSDNLDPRVSRFLYIPAAWTGRKDKTPVRHHHKRGKLSDEGVYEWHKQ